MQSLALLIYITMIITISLVANSKVKTGSDFILGGRSSNAITTALGAGVADMSGWVMMALPGLVFREGACTIWYIAGLFIGAFLNWVLVAKKLRIATEQLNNSQTLSSYFNNRFNDTKGDIKILVAICTTIFYIIYMSSALVALAFFVEKIFSIDYYKALLISSAFIIMYVSLGGFTAINWVDIMQGILMLAALIIVPVSMMAKIGIGVLPDIKLLDGIGSSSNNMDISILVTSLAWGLGYFGQPHILTRFMAIRNVGEIKISAIICLGWMALSLIGAFCTGLFGRVLFPHILNPEVIFLQSAETLLHPLFIGVVFAAVLASIISSVAAQLHTTSSTIVEDVVCSSVQIQGQRKIVYLRMTTVLLIIFSFLVALNPNTTVLELVTLAWSGLGSSIGPTLLFSLHARRMTKKTAMWGILTGAVVTTVWYFASSNNIMFRFYTIIPGFLFSSLVITLRNFYDKTKLTHQLP
jgi:sodium/proline symporter